jgi:predicted DNA-binding transcriptional regulator YafY
LYNPTTRLLTVLELLQARGRISGAELAERLEVDQRSVRRYVTMLQDIGIPISGERGRHGGYRLRPGFKLPPLMFTEDEALAVTLGLVTAQRLGVAGGAPAFEGALAKVDRVLPPAVREQLRGVQESLTFDVPASTPPAAASVLAFSAGVRDHRRVHIRYHSENGRQTERDVDPYGLVYRTTRWYAVGWCHLRTDVRVFRLDRVLQAQLLDDRFTPPDGFDVQAELVKSLASAWAEWTVEVILETSLEEARKRISPIVGTVEQATDGVLLRSKVDTLDWAAHYLMGLPWPVRVVSPSELRSALRRLRGRIDRTLGSPAPLPTLPGERGGES